MSETDRLCGISVGDFCHSIEGDQSLWGPPISQHVAPLYQGDVPRTLVTLIQLAIVANRLMLFAMCAAWSLTCAACPLVLVAAPAGRGVRWSPPPVRFWFPHGAVPLVYHRA